MLNRKAQALVEFILILPIILILIFCMIDIGYMFIEKNNLENTLSDNILLLDDNFTINDLKKELNKQNINVKILENKETKYITINASKDITWISPITNLILPKYKISLKRVISNE